MINAKQRVKSAQEWACICWIASAIAFGYWQSSAAAGWWWFAGLGAVGELVDFRSVRQRIRDLEDLE